MNKQETKSSAYSILVRRLVAYLVDILLLFAAVMVTQFGLEALTGGLYITVAWLTPASRFVAYVGR